MGGGETELVMVRRHVREGYGHILLVVGFRLCRSGDRERSIEEIGPPCHWDNFVTVAAENQHFVILKACEITAMTAPSRSTLRESTALAEVA